jgi:hypothetical protein
VAAQGGLQPCIPSNNPQNLARCRPADEDAFSLRLV